MKFRKSPIPLALEFLIVIGLTYGVAISRQLLALHPHKLQDVFTNARLLRLVIFELFAGGLALAVLRFNGRRLSDHDMKFKVATVGEAFLLFLATMLADYVVYDLVLYSAGLAETQPALTKPFGLSFPVVVLVSLVNPLFEEGILLAYVIPTLRSQGLKTALGVSLFLRLATHLYQGPQAEIGILLTGLLFFFYYWRTQKIWPPVLAHAMLDFLGLRLLG
jgi:membrane protease YdiL (CAAX protease family)